MDNTLTMIATFAEVSASTSWLVYQYGIPFGGIYPWTLIVIMSDDSGEHPYAPLIAALVGYPIILICDTILFIPALYIFFTMWCRPPSCRRIRG